MNLFRPFPFTWLPPLAAVALTISGLAWSPTVNADDWPRFLGGGGALKASSDVRPPTTWSDEDNLKWKLELPGPGVSSPIVVGDKVFVTAYSGYGTGGEDEKMEDLKRHLLCVDRSTGNVVWSKKMNSVAAEDPFVPPGVAAHGYASHTPVSDGENVYVFLGKSGVVAFDLDGNPKWRTTVGTGSGPMKWGSASSPV